MQLTQILHSRVAALGAAALLAIIVAVSFFSGDIVPIMGNRGLAFPSTNLWIAFGGLSTCVNIVLLYGIAAGLSALNKAFNIMRSLTSLWAAMFLMFQCGTPMVSGQFSGSSVLAVIFLIVTAELFSCYGNPRRRRPVFLIFFILSGSSFFQYGYMFYIPVVALGMVQMRIMNARTAVAALLGVITPPWILFGTGILTFDDVSWPHFVSSLSAIDRPEVLSQLVATGATALLGIGFFVGNVFKLLSYNARNRAFNGFFAVMMLATIVLLAIDYNNLALYATLLSLLSAYQVAHFFSSRRHPKSYISILVVAAIPLATAVVTFLF